MAVRNTQELQLLLSDTAPAVRDSQDLTVLTTSAEPNVRDSQDLLVLVEQRLSPHPIHVTNTQDLAVLTSTTTPAVRDGQDLLVLVEQRLNPHTIDVRNTQELMLVIERRFISVAVVGNFQNADGSPLANGTLKIRLNCDATTMAGKSVAAKRTVTATLDSDGSVPAGVRVFPNSKLSNDYMGAPTVYFMEVYSAAGQLVWGRHCITVTDTDPFDLGSVVPDPTD